MARWESPNGGDDEWFTPSRIFRGDARARGLRVRFDLDVASPAVRTPAYVVPANGRFAPPADGLRADWRGRFVWTNPPFGRRNGVVPWLRRFVENANGIGLVRAYTSAEWFGEWMPRMDLLLFPFGKTRFVRPDGTVPGFPGSGVVLFAIGDRGVAALAASGLGLVGRLQ